MPETKSKHKITKVRIDDRYVDEYFRTYGKHAPYGQKVRETYRGKTVVKERCD